METKHKYAKLEKQIRDGQKDAFLNALQKNADNVVCYAIWKAVEERRKTIKLEKKGVVEKAYIAPFIADWIRVGAHTVQDNPCIESVARLLDKVFVVYPNIRDIETFSLAHVRCRSLAADVGLAQCEAFTELGETASHYVKFIAGKDNEGLPYWSVTVKVGERVIASVNYSDEEEAIAATLQVIEDECLL